VFAPDTHFVDLVRDFLEAHGRLEAVAQGYRKGTLDFGEVRALVGDDDHAALFRLKERSHALYRDRHAGGSGIGPGELFDLAVGSLFHEAMKFREGFYQHASYGPRLETLRRSEVADEQGLLPQFEKVLDDTRARIGESLEESERWAERIAGQLPGLLSLHRDEGPLVRFLVERGDDVAALVGMDAAGLLARLHGSVSEARVRAARSYLASGFFAEALRALDGARGERAAALSSYAQGMVAYLDGDYPGCVQGLAAWAGRTAPDPALAAFALSALGSAASWADDACGLPGADALIERIREGLPAEERSRSC